ncbi:putative receptor protein kinase ZmPK1 [Tanacetum coccineum]
MGFSCLLKPPDIDESKMTYGKKSCESIPAEESLPKPVVIEPKTSENVVCKSNLSAESPEFIPQSVCSKNKNVKKTDKLRKNIKTPRGLLQLCVDSFLLVVENVSATCFYMVLAVTFPSVLHQDVFNVIVDGGSSENIISRDIVTRLNLTLKKHPKPYKIGWIKAVGEVRVIEQCEVLFAMGKYKDTVLFDIVDMDCHVLLGGPWQSDLIVVHKGKENTYTFSKGGRKFTLCPYSDEVQATATKVKTNHIMLCSTRNKEKNICATTIPPDQVLYPIKNSWSSSFQEEENDGEPKLEKRIKE